MPVSISRPLLRSLPVAASILLSLLVRGTTFGQPVTSPEPPKRDAWAIELLGGVGVALNVGSGSLASSYVPSLEGFGTGGTATQTLSFEAAESAAFSLGIAVWPRENVGMELVADWTEADLGGVSSPYAVHLEYQARQPPDYELESYVWESSTAWPDPTGSLEVLSLSMSAVGRWQVSPRLAGTLSGGVTAQYVDGEIDSLGFTSFRMGGHSVLFPELYRVGMALEPDWVVGLGFGASLIVSVSRRASLEIGYRYQDGSDTELSVRVREVLNADEIISPVPPDAIEAALSSAIARIDSGGSRVHLGLRFRLR